LIISCEAVKRTWIVAYLFIAVIAVIAANCRSAPTLTIELATDENGAQVEIEQMLSMAGVAHQRPVVDGRRIRVKIDGRTDPGHRRLVEATLARLAPPVSPRPRFATEDGATLDLARGAWRFQARGEWTGRTDRCIWEASVVEHGRASRGDLQASDPAFAELARSMRRESPERATIIFVESGADPTGRPLGRFEGRVMKTRPVDGSDGLVVEEPGDAYRFDFSECGPAILTLADDAALRALFFPSLAGRVRTFTVE
jgi:hypothetical protein